MDKPDHEDLAKTVIALSKSVIHLCDTLKHIHDMVSKLQGNLKICQDQCGGLIDISTIHTETLSNMLNRIRDLEDKVNNNRLDFKSE